MNRSHPTKTTHTDKASASDWFIALGLGWCLGVILFLASLPHLSAS